MTLQQDIARGTKCFRAVRGGRVFGLQRFHRFWAAGLLFDIVNIDGNDLKFANLEQYQFGTGWNTANSMMWQCTAAI